MVVIFCPFDRQNITTQIHWRGLYACERNEVGGGGVCHGGEKQDSE